MTYRLIVLTALIMLSACTPSSVSQRVEVNQDTSALEEILDRLTAPSVSPEDTTPTAAPANSTQPTVAPTQAPSAEPSKAPSAVPSAEPVPTATPRPEIVRIFVPMQERTQIFRVNERRSIGAITLFLENGDTLLLNNPTAALYVSSNPSVASVSDRGDILARQSGDCNIGVRVGEQTTFIRVQVQ
ncbi:MAG: hypothetical protein IGS03_16305 [Candidatus Sericytochromatia bacterium]|nr:hypothetical protein [Candidatus Sericytochromatia bacterium]